VCWITRCARSQEWFGKIAVHECDTRRNTTAQRIGARNSQRFAREVGGNEAQWHRGFIGKRHGERTATSANFCGVEWVRRATKRTIGGNAIRKKGECRLDNEFALWSRVKDVGRYE
jgi:hypothetical protein